MSKAILVMTYGTPEEYTFEGIAKFFTNIRRGVRPNDEEINLLLKKLSSHWWFSPSGDNT